ncbi:MAG TPA: hypothetical protein VFC63_01030 [Blastocatellia bacterium]|nr:hypothetical protein [Blastocatellia bacterium]
MEADEAENGESEIEFVTRPPIEETPAGYLKLKKVMDDIVDIGKKMLVYSGQKEFPLSLVTGVDLDDGTIVYPKDTTMSAGPQATTGLNLAVVRKFMLSFMAPDLQSKAKHPKFYGFLSLIQQYLSAGTQDAEGQYLAYPKMIAQPLLARTDFGKLFQLIESDVRDYYLQHKNKWVPDVLGMVGLKGAEKKDVLARGVMEKSDRYFQLMRDRKLMQYDINDEDQELSRKITALDLDISLLDKQITNYKESLFNFQPSKKSLEEKRDKLLEQKIPLGLRRAKLRGPVMEIDYEMRHLESTVRYANLTVENWLNSILDNNDLLPKVKDAESMGEFGQKVEKIGPIGNQEDAGIFEYRGDQASKIKLTEWPKFALNFFEKVMKAHGHQID